jgi:protein-S-isoprenylcysteine O-methyltransferase Ste14
LTRRIRRFAVLLELLYTEDVKFLELKVPPLVLVLMALAAQWALSRFVSVGFVDFPGRPALSGSLLVSGALVAVSGVLAFRKAQTTVNPTTPLASSTVVQTGIYARTRNPMYLGMALGLLASALALGSALALLPLVIFLVYMTRFQIEPEEHFLRAKFGANYDTYCNTVRRWL